MTKLPPNYREIEDMLEWNVCAGAVIVEPKITNGG